AAAGGERERRQRRRRQAQDRGSAQGHGAALAERAAAAHAEPAEHDGGGAEAGDAGLQQVGADEGGQPQPQRRDEVGQQQAAEDHHAGEGEDGAVEVHGCSPWGRVARQRVRSMPSSLSTYFSYTGSVWPDFIFIRKYFSNATLARCTHLPARLQVTLRGGICGSATKAMPVSPMSARQMAFQVACAVAGSPASSARMFCAM